MGPKPRTRRSGLHAMPSFALIALVTTMGTSLPTPSVASGTGVGGDPASRSWLPDLQMSDQLSGPTLIRGRLVDAAGAGTSGHLTVIAWPRMDVLGRLADGDSVKTMPVAKTVAKADGSFILRIDPNVPVEEFTEDDGTVNFELVGARGDRLVVFAFARRFDPVANIWRDPSLPLERGAADELGVTLSLDQFPAIAPAGVPAPSPALDKSDCGVDVLATYNDRPVVNGEVYTGPNATAQFVYTTGATSALGVGFSASGSFGSFQQGGEAVASSSAGISYPVQGTNRKTVFRTSWQYKKFREWHWNEWMTYCSPGFYTVRPTLWWGGSSWYTAASAPSAPYCAWQGAGVELWKERGTAITFTNGADLNVGAVGVYLSARTGFNQSTKIKYKFLNNGWLCGSNAPWPDAARVVAK